MLVFQDSEMRYPFDFRSRVRCSRGRCKGVLFLRQICHIMLPSKVMSCFPFFEDNQSAVKLAQDPVMNSNSKHIDVRRYFLRERVRQRDIKVVQVPPEFQHAGILTKALVYNLFVFHRKFLTNLKFLVE